MDKISTLVTKKIITVHADEKIAFAAELMREHNIRHLPVKDSLNRWVGILSDRDVLRAVIPVDVSENEGTFQHNDEHLVRYFMSWPIRSVSMNDTVDYIAKLMINEKISCFLVVDVFSMEPEGIITTEDLMKYLLKASQKLPQFLNEPIRNIFEFLPVPTYE